MAIEALEMKTLAEGIELPAQLRALRREGCDYGQGFLFSPPVEPEALEALLKRTAAEAKHVLRPAAATSR